MINAKCSEIAVVSILKVSVKQKRGKKGKAVFNYILLMKYKKNVVFCLKIGHFVHTNLLLQTWLWLPELFSYKKNRI